MRQLLNATAPHCDEAVGGASWQGEVGIAFGFAFAFGFGTSSWPPRVMCATTLAWLLLGHTAARCCEACRILRLDCLRLARYKPPITQGARRHYLTAAACLPTHPEDFSILNTSLAALLWPSGQRAVDSAITPSWTSLRPFAVTPFVLDRQPSLGAKLNLRRARAASIPNPSSIESRRPCVARP